MLVLSFKVCKKRNARPGEAVGDISCFGLGDAGGGARGESQMRSCRRAGYGFADFVFLPAAFDADAE